MFKVRPFHASDFADVARIYQQGLETGIATFETKVPDWESWDAKYLDCCRLVAHSPEKVIGFAVLAPVSNRQVYSGVAEVSVYVDAEHRDHGIGTALLKALIEESESHGFWTLQASIFPENERSIKLHLNFDFRLVGIREKIGNLNGKWYDNALLERRSKQIGIS